jgi:hypothetical protein
VIAPRVRVELVFDGTPMPARFEASAMNEATLIWAPYGVDLYACAAGCVRLGSDIRLAVTLADHQPRDLGPRTLGSIQFVDEVPEPAIAMYPNSIAALTSGLEILGRRERWWPDKFRDLILGRALGRALAHEIGHFLLRTQRHSTTGLMRALHPAASLFAHDRHPFALSAEEVTRLVSFQSSPAWRSAATGE